MRVVVVGISPAGLSAAFALLRDGHQVTLVESHGPPYSSVPSLLDTSLLEREGLLGDRLLQEAPLGNSLQHRQLSLGIGSSAFGKPVTLPSPGHQVVVNRHRFVEWFVEVLSDAGANVLRGSPAESVIRYGDRVIGVHGEFGSLRSDLVFLAERSPSRLALDGDYTRTLPGNNPDYSISIREEISCSAVDLPDQFIEQELNPPMVFSSFLPSPSRGIPMNGLLELLITEENSVIDLKLPLDRFQQSELSAEELYGWVRGLPGLPDELELAETQHRSIHLARVNGRSRWSSLCDHGLALGGESAGLGSLLSGYDSRAQIFSGYQFARTVTHLDRRSSPPSRENLRTVYQRSLSQELDSGFNDVLGDLFVSDNAGLGRLVSNINHGIERPLTTFSTGLFNVGNILSGLSSVTSPEKLWGLVEGSDRFLAQLNAILETVDIRELFLETVTKSDVGLTTVLQRLLNHLLAEAFSGGTSDKERLRSIKIFAEIIERVGTLLVADSSRPDSALNSISLQPAEFSHDDDVGNVVINTPVKSSLEIKPKKFTRLTTLCPTDVYKYDGIHASMAPERCIQCGACVVGHFEQSVRSAVSSSNNSLYPPEEAYLNPVDLWNEANIPVEFRRRLASHQRRLKQAGDALNEQYVTAESVNWIQGQVHFFRRDLLNRSEDVYLPDELQGALFDVIQDLQTALAGGDLAGTVSSVKLLSECYLDPFDPSGSTSKGTERSIVAPQGLTETERHSSTKNMPPTPSQESEYPGIRSEQSFPSLVEKTFLELGRQLKNISREEQSTNDRQTDGSWCPGFLDPGNQCVITTLESADTYELSRIVVAGNEETTLDPSDLTVRDEVRFGNLLLRRYQGENLNDQYSLPNEIDSRDLQKYLDTVRRGYIHLSNCILVHSRYPNSADDFCSLLEEKNFPRLLDEYANVRLKALCTLTLEDQLPAKHDPTDTLAALTQLQSSLCSGSDSLLRSDNFSVGINTVSEGDLSTLSDFIGGFPYSLTTLYTQLAETVNPNPTGSDFLSLSSEMESTWAESDRTGIIDHRIRQWRNEIGELRASLSDSRITSKQAGRIASHLWRSKIMITDVIKHLLDGTATRREKVVLDWFMKRSHQMTRKVSFPESSTEQESNEQKPNENPRVMDDLLRSYDFSILDRIIMESSDSFESVASDAISTWFKTTDISSEPFWIQAMGRLYDLSRRFERYEKETDSITSRLRSNSVVASANDLVEFLENHTNFRKDLDVDSLRLTNNTAADVVSDNQLGTGLKRLTDRLRQDVSAMENDLGESVKESLESFVELNQKLRSKPNLFPVLDHYLGMVSELIVYRDSLSKPELPSRIEAYISARNRSLLETYSSLFNHGVSMVRNGVEPPESQLLDLEFPGSILGRRLRSVDR
jgi:ferredoxin-like protein FixX